MNTLHQKLQSDEKFNYVDLGRSTIFSALNEFGQIVNVNVYNNQVIVVITKDGRLVEKAKFHSLDSDDLHDLFFDWYNGFLFKTHQILDNFYIFQDFERYEK